MKVAQQLISEVEKRQNEVKVNTKLRFAVHNDSMVYVVTELFDGGFEAIDEDGEKSDFYFNELQTGWFFIK